MQPARFRQEDILLVEINNAKSMSPAVSSGRSAGSFPEQRLVIEPTETAEIYQSQRLERPQYPCLSVNIQNISLEVALNKATESDND